METIKLSVPLPEIPSQSDAIEDQSGYWERSQFSDKWILTRKGVHYIRGEVRAVHKAERERWFPWLALVVSSGMALVALIISIINMISS